MKLLCVLIYIYGIPAWILIVKTQNPIWFFLKKSTNHASINQSKHHYIFLLTEVDLDVKNMMKKSKKTVNMDIACAWFKLLIPFTVLTITNTNHHNISENYSLSDGAETLFQCCWIFIYFFVRISLEICNVQHTKSILSLGNKVRLNRNAIFLTVHAASLQRWWSTSRDLWQS